MSAAGWIEIALYVAILTAITPLLGAYMTRVYRAPARWGEQDWKAYARSVLAFTVVSFVLLYVILRPRMAYDLALNTTASFVTNTNWQYYAGETTLTNLQQMAGLAVQNFVSAAVGISVAIAFIRALAARSGKTIGNFYSDLIRTLVHVLLPISVVVGLVLVSQGVIQSLTAGPVASQEVIKELGTNGGGFFNTNSATPFENPTWLSNFIEMLLILAIPAALTSVYGRMVGNRRQGWAIFSAMLALFVVGVVVVAIAENNPSPAMHAAGIDGFNMEGKEQRFGVASTALFAVVTTVASCGAVNGAMESLTGIGGLVPMANMQTGEVIFGGVGSGLYGMLMFAILGVFLAGLMVGRTPEFLGKKIEAREIKLTVFGTIGVPLLVLGLSAIAIATKWGQASIYDSGPQGWSETLYAYTSQANNNGSAFAGYTGVTFANLLGSVALLFGRFVPLLAVLAIAGSLVGKRVTPAGLGTFRTDSPTFVVVLVGIVVLVALLTFVPALLLGPVAQGMTDQLF